VHLLRASTRRRFCRLAAAAAGILSGSASFAKDQDDRHRRDDDDREDDRRDDHRSRDDDDRHVPGGTFSCFLKGTRISTTSGPRPVQELQIGEHISTFAGPKPIKWIGYRKFRRAHNKIWIAGVLPICIARGAIHLNRPHDDLYLSPAHCLFLDNVLIAAEYLVNDVSIRRETPSETDVIEYYHIELETHDVIFAEGLPVESYLGSDRENFSNFVQFQRLYGGQSQSEKTSFAPIIGYYGGRDELKGLLRSMVSPFVDIRDPIQVEWDRIALRAKQLQD
jgi:hypothetical protein